MQHTDAKRVTKLRGLLERLKQGKNVQNRDLQTWLGADGYKRYEDAWAAQLDLRDDLENKPDAIIEYEARLKRANFTYNRAERFSQQGRHVTAKRLFGQADTEYEHLLERLQEIIAADLSLNVWFDRDTAWTADGELSLDPESVPQIVTSKGRFNRARNGGLQMAKMDKRRVKIAVIENELAQMEPTVSPPDIKRALSRHKAMMKLINSEKDSD